MDALQRARMAMRMRRAGPAYRAYGRQTMADFAARFSNPYVRTALGSFFPAQFSALTFVTTYAFYSSGRAAIPLGGSLGLVQRMQARFEALGGRVECNTEVTGLERAEGRVVALKLQDGRSIAADAYIWAADPHRLFHELLEPEEMPATLRRLYDEPQSYAAISGFQAAFGIAGDEPLDLPSGTVLFPCAGYEVAGVRRHICGIRVYDYDPQLYPPSRRVIQCNILQDAWDYAFWSGLSREDYRLEKRRVAELLKRRIERQYPQLRGRLLLLDCYTPLSFARWCHAHQGAYMSFQALPGAKARAMSPALEGLANLFLASQWTQTGGGLPIAATSGKFAAERLCRGAPTR